MIQRLPSEIFIHIIHAVATLDNQLAYRVDSQNLWQLAVMARLSQSFHAWTTPKLYERVCLRKRRQWLKFAFALDSNAGLATLVKSLLLSSDGQISLSTFLILSSILVKCGPTLDRLVMSSSFKNSTMSSNVGLRCPSLSELVLLTLPRLPPTNPPHNQCLRRIILFDTGSSDLSDALQFISPPSYTRLEEVYLSIGIGEDRGTLLPSMIIELFRATPSLNLLIFLVDHLLGEPTEYMTLHLDRFIEFAKIMVPSMRADLHDKLRVLRMLSHTEYDLGRSAWVESEVAEGTLWGRGTLSLSDWLARYEEGSGRANGD